MLDVDESEQQKAGPGAALNPAATSAVVNGAMAPTVAQGVMVIDQPAPNERRIVDLNSAQKVTFGFTLADVSVSIVDVDVILIFSNGGRLILPSFVLNMIAAEPPQLVFSGLLTDPQNVIAAAGDIRLVDQLPQLTLSDNARTPSPGQAASPSPEPPTPPAPQTVQMTATQSYAHTPAPSERTRQTSESDPDNSPTGSLRRSSSLAEEQQNQSLKGEGALTERSDKVDGQTGNVIQKANGSPSITSDGGSTSASLVMDENGRQITAMTASDPDNSDTLLFAISGGRDAAKFAINGTNGKLYFIAPPDFEDPDSASGNGTYEVEVQVSDGREIDTQTISVTIRNLNEAPVGATFSGGNLAENSAAGTSIATVTGTDVDVGDVVRYSFAPNGDASGRFAIDATTGLITLVRGDLIDFEASNRQLVIVRLTDQGGLTYDTPIVLTILDANDAPEITSNGGGVSAGITIAENTSIITTVIATDEDANSTITYAIAAGADAAAFTIDAVSGVITFRATPDFERPADANFDNVYLIVVEASDGQGGLDRQSLAITIVNSNDPPSDIILSNARVAENAANGTVVGTASGQDPDDNAILRYSLAPGGNAGGRFAINALTGELTVVDGTRLDFESGPNHLIIIRVTDQGGLSLDRAFTISLDDVNEAPVITANGGADVVAIGHAESLLAVGQITARDPEGAALTYSITGGADAAFFVIDPFTGLLAFTAGPDFELPLDADGNNAYEVVVTVSDGTMTDQQSLTIQVTNTGEPPVILSNGGGLLATVQINEGSTFITQVVASDPDVGAVVSYSIAGGVDAARFVIDGATGALTLLSAADFENPLDLDGDNTYQVIVRASDGLLFDQQTIVVSVLNVNDAPEIVSNGGGDSASLQIEEGTSLVTTIAATDPDRGAVLFFAITGGPDAALFSLNSATGQLRFLSTADFEIPTDVGADNVYNIVVQVLDGLGGTDTQTIAVTVTNQNEAPVIVSNGGLATAALGITENGTTVTTIAATDTDAGAVLGYSIVGGADAARFVINSATGVLTFVAAPDFEAPTDVGGNNVYDVIVQVSDGLGGTDTQTIAVTVTNQNEAPVITSDGAAATAVISVQEAGLLVTTVAASDQDI
ncbi:MAG: cadherin domain-containing protein, partial [Bosea sp. (in: a-proteobacteria)]